MKTHYHVFFIAFVFSIFSLVGCSSGTSGDLNNFVEDSVDKALNQKNTEYINPDKLADTKEEALRYASTLQAPSNQSSSANAPSSNYVPMSGSGGASVIIVNPDKKFAVVDFYSSSTPPIGTELRVLRAGQVVGVIRITNPVKAPLASADIVNGTLARGDQVSR